nr:putative ribonuclease H-like domain-containing protein [Tanacetum cinerariifolium]
MSYLSNFEEFNGGYVAFGGNPKGGKITSKGKIKTEKLDFDNVYFVKELKFNLFSVLQICDKKNSVLFTDTKCLVLTSDFKLSDESQVLLRVPRENNMYNVNLKNIVPSGDLTCLFAKATLDESNLWHRRLAHVNFKTINKLVKGNLVTGLPTKVFENDYTYVACKKGKQHRASCKTKLVCSIDQPLFRLHMDLFGLTFIKSMNKKSYCLVITDDYSRFTWVFFLAIKDETTPILKTFLTGLENQLSLKVKVIRSDNGTKFKNYDLNQFCRLKGIKRGFSVPRTPQQNGIDEMKNRTLIEAARTMFQDNLDAEKAGEEVDQSYMLFLVWSSVGSTNPQNNVEDAAFDGKEHDFDVNKPEFNVILSPSSSAQSKEQDDKTIKEAKGKTPDESVTGYRYLNEEFHDYSENSSNEFTTASSTVPTVGQNSLNSTNTFSATGPLNTTVSPTYGQTFDIDASQFPDNSDMPRLEDIIYSDDKDVVGVEADFNNLESSIPFSPIPTTRIHKDHSISQIIGDLSATTQTRNMTRAVKDQEKPLLKNPDGEDVDVHTYRSMIGSLMYLTLSRPDIMFAVCECARFQVTPKASHLHAVKQIFRYLKGKPHLGLWYPNDSPFDLVAYSDSDYAGQIVVATSSTEAEYVAAVSCYAQSNDVTRLQALVKKKKVVITEATIRDALYLDDAEGVDCLPNEEIFAELARHKFNFSKYIFESLVRNIDSSSKFYMYIRFIQLIIQNQLGVETPLFEGMLVAGEIQEQGDAEEEVQDDIDDAVAQGADAAIEGDDGWMTDVLMVDKEDEKKTKEAMGVGDDQEAVDVVTTAKLITEVVSAASELVSTASITTAAAEPQVPAATITAAQLDYFKGMSYDDIRLIFEAKFNSNIEFLLKSKEQIEEEGNRAIQSINVTPAQKAAKRRKLNDEVEDLKQHLEIVPDEDDDVYTEATPLARKVPVVDYEIIHFNNKPHYKIIHVNGTHQLYVSFITLLKNFDREDLESLWSLVKERFSTSKPNNFSDDYLLNTLGVMFERPNGQAQV